MALALTVSFGDDMNGLEVEELEQDEGYGLDWLKSQISGRILSVDEEYVTVEIKGGTRVYPKSQIEVYSVTYICAEPYFVPSKIDKAVSDLDRFEHFAMNCEKLVLGSIELDGAEQLQLLLDESGYLRDEGFFDEEELQFENSNPEYFRAGRLCVTEHIDELAFIRDVNSFTFVPVD